MFPKRLDRKNIYESEWINLYIDRVLMPSGKIIEKYHQLDYPRKSTVILLLNSKGEICFIKALRYTTQKVEWELPAGGAEENEDIIKTAEREVFEETGLKAKNLKIIHIFNPSNGMSNQKVHIVFGKINDCTPTKFDTDEVREVHWLSLDKVKDMIMKNEINDGISLLPLLLYISGIVKSE